MENQNTNLLKVFQKQRSVSTDTRKIAAGDIFFALKGPNFNGNKFAAQALDSGAAYAVIDEVEFFPENDPRYFLVEDVLLALQQLGRDFRNTFDIPIIGITGTNGKTTTKELMASVLQTEKRVHFTRGNLNNHIGVPLTLLALPDDAEIAIIEMGANRAGDIRELVEIARPTHGLLTNIGRAHLERFGDIDGVQKTKGELFDFLRETGGMAWVNLDDPRVRAVGTNFAQMRTFGTEGADYYITEADYGDFETNMSIRIPGESQPLQLKTVLIGSHNAQNVLAAVAVGHTMGISLSGIRHGIESYQPTNNRTQMARIGGMNFLIDCYNANPSSMEATIRSVFAKDRGKIALVLGDMLELGENELQMHADLVQYCNQYPVSKLIGVGPRMEHAVSQSKASHSWYARTAEALPAIKKELEGMDFVLLKGSRGIALEGLLKAWES